MARPMQATAATRKIFLMARRKELCELVRSLRKFGDAMRASCWFLAQADQDRSAVNARGPRTASQSHAGSAKWRRVMESSGTLCWPKLIRWRKGQRRPGAAIGKEGGRS